MEQVRCVGIAYIPLKMQLLENPRAAIAGQDGGEANGAVPVRSSHVSDACRPGYLARRPDKCVIDVKPKVSPIQPIRFNEFSDIGVSAPPLGSVRAHQQEVIILPKQL